MKRTPTVFDPQHKFQDEVWGRIILSDLERDVIDTPEFQRLFRTSQLGFVDLVYQTANHTRGAHSIGACHVASLLMDRLDRNCPPLAATEDGWVPVPINLAERVLIRLGALLHDISHVPLSHDLERKTHKITYDSGELKVRSYYGHYDKHDDYKSNPLLYLLIYNADISVLARLLRWYSRPFYLLLTGTDPDGTPTPPSKHLEGFINLLRTINDDDWRPEDDLLPDLVFHLLMHEDPKQAVQDDAAIQNIAKRYDADCLEEWGLGPKPYRSELHRLWYQPFRHDIIGDTLSADLIDYLRRDSQRLGMDRRIDLHLLNYYVLKRYNSEDNTHSVPDAPDARPKRFRCAIDLHDHKRNTSRIELVNDIFRLLDLRHEIHEKAVLHRVVQAANAMLARALLLLGDEKKPTARELVRLDEPVHALQGEESFFQLLVDRSNPKNKENIAAGPRLRDANRLIHKLIERRVCRPLLIIPGYQAAEYLKEPDTELTHKNVEQILRTIAMIIDSRYYSRFLLFVSACIEKYLQGMFHSCEDLCGHVESIINNGKPADDAMELLPSRVIIWTTPYKQLYKDPALVVALGATVCQIDELHQDGMKDKRSAERDSSLLRLVKASIEDADAKYAALWKLYVFISDGLFYSGVLGKLARAREREYGIVDHKRRLEECQALVVKAVRVVDNNWRDIRAGCAKAEERGQRLSGSMEREEFRDLVYNWKKALMDMGESTRALVRRVCRVDVEYYAHSWDGSRNQMDSNCRDVRYKVDATAEAVWALAKRKEAGESEKALVPLLEDLQVDPKALSQLEFQDLVNLLDEETLGKLKKLRSAWRDGNEAWEFVKALLWGTFPHWDARVSDDGKMGDQIAFEADTRFPGTEEELTKWLMMEAEALNPRVRRQFLEVIEPMAGLIGRDIDEGMRAEAMRDVRMRFRNEQRKLFNRFNHIRLGEVLAILKRRWKTNKEA